MRRTETAGAIPESLRRQESSEDKCGSLWICGQAGSGRHGAQEGGLEAGCRVGHRHGESVGTGRFWADLPLYPLRQLE